VIYMSSKNKTRSVSRFNQFRQENQYIFVETEDIYKLKDESIWGKGDVHTINYLKGMDRSGTWLDLAAGDGRYLPYILPHADSLMASDIDVVALRKFRRMCLQWNRDRVDLIVFDITRPFPVINNSFDVVFCTGTLHYFPPSVVEKIVSEMDRVLRIGGLIIFDFAYKVERVLPNSDRHFIKPQIAHYDNLPEPLLFGRLRNHFEIEKTTSFFCDDLMQTHGYIIKGEFALIVAHKIQS